MNTYLYVCVDQNVQILLKRPLLSTPIFTDAHSPPVIRATPVKPALVVATYVCEMCNQELYHEARAVC
jgi:hypothetical protein